MGEERRGSGRSEGKDFIRAIVARHQADGTYGGRVETRFPPEPNGYLHIGHAKSIVLNFGLAAENGGVCHLRFDDTNPLTEDMKYVRSIQDDVRWLGYEWGNHLYFASDYFPRLYESAVILIRKGKAYVDSLSEEEIREYRGTVTEPGRESPFRNRTVEENLHLFSRMKEGEFADGEHVLRAKIDMAHPNMIMRDPVLYRIRHASHYRKGDEWCIYPLYDFTHCLSDAFENITHSLCTLEFDNNREIYDWILDEVGFEEPRSHQYEFARLNLDYTVMSKRKLLRLVNDGHVDGWDDPRMPTIAGMRRRGITPEAIRSFAEMIGVAKADNRVDVGKLEFAIRDHLNLTVPRVLAVLNPLRVVVTNYPAGASEELEAPSYPHDVPLEGSRRVPFSRNLLIEADDFMEDPGADFFRLAPGREVRLRYAYLIRCDQVVKDPSTGEVVELRCTYDPETRGGRAPDGRRVKGTIHWVSADHALPARVRLYDRLFRVPDPEDVPEGEDFTSMLNPASRVVLERAYVEPSVERDPPGTRVQFERLGYFMTDVEDSRAGAPVFNRIVTLKDTWGRRSISGPRRDEGEGFEAGPLLDGKRTVDPDGIGADGKEDPGGRAPLSPGRDTGREARDAVRAGDPELASRFSRFIEEHGLSEDQADILTGSEDLANFFESAVASHPNAAALGNWIVNELLRELKDRPISDLPITPGSLASLVALLDQGTISQPVAKEIFEEMVEEGIDPGAVVKERGLEKISDRAALAGLVDRVLESFPEKVEEFRGGKTGLMGFFTGRIMKETQGRADPRVVQELFRERLKP
ncbi:MAG: glutamine--tRNA ligase/YqeY domain fusion protein [Longimicrobiales bacterium]